MKANSKPDLPLATDPFHPANPRSFDSLDAHSASRLKNPIAKALASLGAAIKGCKAAGSRFSRMQNSMQERGQNAGPIEMMVLLAQSLSKTSKPYAAWKKHETALTCLVNEEHASHSISFMEPYLKLLSKADTQRAAARASAFDALKKELETLESEARAGDQVAFAHLLWISCLASLTLESLVDTHRDVATALAKQYVGWPVFLCPGRSNLEQAQRMLKSLQVGTAPLGGLSLTLRGRKGNDCRSFLTREVEMMQLTRAVYQVYCQFKKLELSGTPFPYHQHGYPVPKTTFVAWLYATKPGLMIRKGCGFLLNQPGLDQDRRLFSRFVNKCIELPDPARKPEVVKAWMRVIKQLLMDFHKDHPEKNPHLRKLGWYRRQHGSAREGTGHWESNIREGMFSKLEQTLRGIFPGSRV